MGSCCLSELGMAQALLCSHINAFLLNWLSPSSYPQSLTVSVCRVHFPRQLLFPTVSKWLLFAFSLFLSFHQSQCSSQTRLSIVKSRGVCAKIHVWMMVCDSERINLMNSVVPFYRETKAAPVTLRTSTLRTENKRNVLIPQCFWVTLLSKRLFRKASLICSALQVHFKNEKHIKWEGNIQTLVIYNSVSEKQNRLRAFWKRHLSSSFSLWDSNCIYLEEKPSFIESLFLSTQSLFYVWWGGFSSSIVHTIWKDLLALAEQTESND